MTFLEKDLKISEKNDTRELLKQLEKGVQELFESERYKAYLNTMSKFHNYSAHNVLLILSQKPESSYVAGYQSWRNNFERHVKKGESGLKIIAPVTVHKEVLKERIDAQTGKRILDESGNPIMDKTTINTKSFTVTKVFDVSQTEGKELPTLATQLTNDISRFSEVIDAIKDAVPVPIEFASLSRANGFYSVKDEKIVIKDTLSEEQKLKTIFHELGHAIMHNADTERTFDTRTREVQAESVAYVMCNHFGIDSSSYSFGYISSWSSDKQTKELKQSLSTIQKTADYLISNIEQRLLERNLITLPQKKDVTPCKTQTKKKNYNKNMQML